MIISDSTTLIVLFDLDRTDLLSNLFSTIIIPTSVFKEISTKNELVLPNFMSVIAVQNSELLESLKMILDDGESEAIALAVETKSKLIIDEKKGRKIAINQGVEIIGLLGIVYLNVKREFLLKQQAIKLLDDIQAHGYRISQRIINDMLEMLNT
jgi:predicted nucleic acid-binding protein